MLRWNEVTWYSKLGAAIVVFGMLPTISFYIGTQIENTAYALDLPPQTVAMMIVRPNLLEDKTYNVAPGCPKGIVDFLISKKFTIEMKIHCVSGGETSYKSGAIVRVFSVVFAPNGGTTVQQVVMPNGSEQLIYPWNSQIMAHDPAPYPSK